MPFTVTSDQVCVKQYEFDAYLRLLNKRGIDWTEADRVEEPTLVYGWSYVWENEENAREFSDSLRKETKSDDWHVREITSSMRISRGPLMPVVIRMIRRSLDVEFALHPHSRSAIIRRFPSAFPLSYVAIEPQSRDDIERRNGSLLEYVALLLTGLTFEEALTLGGCQIVDGRRNEVVWHQRHVDAPEALQAS